MVLTTLWKSPECLQVLQKQCLSPWDAEETTIMLREKQNQMLRRPGGDWWTVWLGKEGSLPRRQVMLGKQAGAQTQVCQA